MSKQTIDTVWAKVTFEAIHCWEGCAIDEVKFLAHPHRHQFVIRAHKRVYHDDRDIEFIVLQHSILRYLHETFPTGDMGSTSCEMLARMLIDQFDLSKCSVSEDDENGAEIEVIE